LGFLWFWGASFASWVFVGDLPLFFGFLGLFFVFWLSFVFVGYLGCSSVYFLCTLGRFTLLLIKSSYLSKKKKKDVVYESLTYSSELYVPAELIWKNSRDTQE
jgi:hypothetical protein